MMPVDAEVDAGFQVIYVAKLTVLRSLSIIVTPRAGIQAYGEKIALKMSYKVDQKVDINGSFYCS